jgi:hypothetical protein
MTPMDINSTPFISYRKIKTDGIDLFDDAWGFYPQFHDVIDTLQHLKPVPGKQLIRRLIGPLRKNG